MFRNTVVHEILVVANFDENDFVKFGHYCF